jgi:glutamate-ammonia-ligase adenylyltransferase
MKNPLLDNVIKSSADPARAGHFFEAISGAHPLEDLSKEQLQLLAALFSGSQTSGNLLVAHPQWLDHLAIEHLRFPRRHQGLRNEAGTWLKPAIEAKDYSGAFSILREFKQREMVRIAARDLGRLGNVPEITREISDVADVCLDAVWQICRQQFVERYGTPFHQNADEQWQPTEFCVLGMGKLGGQELNYSSDVDVLFVYSEEGHVFKEPPTKNKTLRTVLTSHQFFLRLAETFIAEVSRMTEQGSLFRIDLRLRPEGDSGPLCRSLGSYENYYAQWGQTWERMMLIKARGVAGSATLAAEFLEMIQSFRYPRAIGEDVLREIAAMKSRIENEVLRSDELERNVKLGRGGIREIEFIVQAQQLIRAGRQPFLQGSQTLPALEKFMQYDLMPGAEVRSLRDAYYFLRDVEHRLQMDENLQTHTLPQKRDALERLARLMDFKTAKDFEIARQQHTTNVRASFDKLLKSNEPYAAKDVFPAEFTDDEANWKKILAEHCFRDVDKAFHMLREFIEGPGYVHVSPRTAELARRLLPKLFSLCPKSKVQSPESLPATTAQSAIGNRQSAILSDPDRVITRLDSFVTAYGARAPLFELWNSNPAIFELLIKLFDRSEFLAELAIRTPDLVDELVISGRLRRGKTTDETLRDLRHGLKDEDQFAWLRRYHQAELMRIGLRDILGLADPEQYLTELSALADACLQYALEVVMRKNKIKSPPFVVIGLGKLGGQEIDYGSDLDIVFVAPEKTKDLRKLQRIATDFMELISNRTELGIVFRTDARLRPDGEKGLLVNTLGAYEDYYRKRAQLWEVQSLTRTRPVAGDREIGENFQQLAAELTNFRSADFQIGVKNKMFSASGRFGNRRSVACFTPDWKSEIHKMRMRIEKERTPAGKNELAIKTGKGGLMDAEFIAQTLCLENGWQIANTLRALERGRETKKLPDAEKLIANYRELRRVEGILRRWSYEGETVLPDDPAPYYRVSVRCGFETPEKFRQALAHWRNAIRQVYEKVFRV